MLIHIYIISLLCSIVGVPADTLRTVDLDEVSVVSTLKEQGSVRQQAMSITRIGERQLAAYGISDLKGIGTMSPNFFMPDYGSRQTSAIYMRGIGSRIGTPAVGLYVDNVAYYDKSAFDFSLYDIEAVDVLRGPQSTLYGRNTMSGLLKIYTRNPFEHSGTDVRLGVSAQAFQRNVSLTHYHRVSDRLAFSAGGFYRGSNGFFRQGLTGEKVDAMEAAGGRLRAIWRSSDRLTFDATLGYEFSDEGAYPYYYTGTTLSTPDAEQYPDLLGRITANLDGHYRRNMVNASINAEYRTTCMTLNSVTSYQHIADNMFMDQDFLSADIYSLGQRQRINTLSEELVLKNNNTERWGWLVGANVFGQWTNTQAPVTFRKDGVAWLNAVIKDKMSVSPMPMTVTLIGDELAFRNNFDTPVFGAALFHQSTFRFGDTGLSATLGVRMDYERTWLSYDAWDNFRHSIAMMGQPTLKDVASRLEGKLANDYVELLPKLSLKYDCAAGNVYAAISRGYRSGGYNVQNFSELMRAEMMSSVISNVTDYVEPKLPTTPPHLKPMILGILNNLKDTHPDVEATCSYNPEYAWNYEAGTHLTTRDRRMALDLSAFLTDVRDLQLSRMSETGLGRTIVNAGRSRSVGVEVAMRYYPADNLAINASYGFTHATFRDYTVTDADGSDVDCSGNRVPYVPEHTANIDVAYTIPVRSGILSSMTIGVDGFGAGRIYWDETNAHSQAFYTQFGARLQFHLTTGLLRKAGTADLQLWARNLTNAHYNTFWFESMNRGYEQHAKPLQLGATVMLHL